MLNKNDDLFLIMAMADAYGAGVEFIEKHPDIMEVQVAKALKFEEYLEHPFNLKPGFYTDDTEMSVANAKVLIEYNYPFTKLQFAQAYLDEFKRGGQRKGYAQGFYKFLLNTNSAEQFLKTIKPDSTKNGAAMRSVPFGVMDDIEQMLETATLQASITHNTPEGLFSARAIALMSHFAFHQETPFSHLKLFTAEYLPFDDFKEWGWIFAQDWDGGYVNDRHCSSISVTTVHAVSHLLQHHDDYIPMMEQLIKWRGDTDSVAALAWSILSARNKDISSIPAFMREDLEGGNMETGELYLTFTGGELMDKYSL